MLLYKCDQDFFNLFAAEIINLRRLIKIDRNWQSSEKQSSSQYWFISRLVLETNTCFISTMYLKT